MSDDAYVIIVRWYKLLGWGWYDHNFPHYKCHFEGSRNALSQGVASYVVADLITTPVKASRLRFTHCMTTLINYTLALQYGLIITFTLASQVSLDCISIVWFHLTLWAMETAAGSVVHTVRLLEHKAWESIARNLGS